MQVEVLVKVYHEPAGAFVVAVEQQRAAVNILDAAEIKGMETGF